jgi:hypothetical protein
MEESADKPEPDLRAELNAVLKYASTRVDAAAEGRLLAQAANLSEAIDSFRRAYAEGIMLTRAEMAHRVRMVVTSVRTGQGDPVEYYAELQAWASELNVIDEVPWLGLNNVIEAWLGEAGLEQLKLAAAHRLGGRRSALLRKANPIRNTGGTAPVASYSARLKARAAKGNRGS